MPPPPIVKRNAGIRNESGEPIGCDIRYDPGAGPRPVVVICHSFMSFKEWGFFPHTALRIAEEGFTTVSFNFSRSGVPPGADRITDFDAFASNSFTKEIGDLASVVRAVREGGLCGAEGDPRKIALLGHSRGGGVAVAVASGDPGLAAIVTWSAISTFDRWTAHQKESWRKEGFLPLSGPAVGGPLRLGRETLHDLDHTLGEIDPLLRAPYITVPWLILHGKADVTVAPGEAEALAAASGSGKTRLLLLDAVGHLYNARSADEDHYMTLNHVISLTVEWLRGVLH
jgi:dienelactone hydrolase